MPDPRALVSQKTNVLEGLEASKRFPAALNRMLDQRHQTVDVLWTRLHALEQAREKLREQGWVTVTDSKGQTLTSARQVRAKDPLTLNFHDGGASVIGVSKDGGALPKKSASPSPRQDSLF